VLDGRSRVLVFDAEQQAKDVVRNIEHYYEGIGGLEVLEYNGV